MKIRIKKTSHPDFNWEVYVPKRLFGKRIRKGCQTHAEATRIKYEYQKQLDDRTVIPIPREVNLVVAKYILELSTSEIDQALSDKLKLSGKANLHLKDFGAEYLAEQKRLQGRGAVGETYVRDTRIRLPKLVDWLGNPRIRNIDKEMIEQFVDARLKEGQSPRTVRNYCNELAAIYNYGIRHKLLDHNPVKEVNLGSYKPEVGILNAPQIQTLLNHACYHMQVWVMFGAFGGLRSSEIGLVEWENVDLDEGQFYVKGKKNVCAERWVTLTPPLKEFCQKILSSDNPPEGPILSGMNSQSIVRRRKKMMKKADVQIPRNALRHSFASHHLVAFGSPNDTAAEMGHVGPQMTFSAYRAAVKKSEAAIYWTVRAHPEEPEPIDGRTVRWRKAA